MLFAWNPPSTNVFPTLLHLDRRLHTLKGIAMPRAVKREASTRPGSSLEKSDEKNMDVKENTEGTPQPPKKKQTTRRKVNMACIYCRRSHMTCDENRPCQRWYVPSSLTNVVSIVILATCAETK